MNERVYQSKLIKEIKRRMPDAFVLKNDPEYLQGVPDLTVLQGNNWAWLEVKGSLQAKSQPNQEFYVEKANELSFGAVICPENEGEVLDALQSAFQSYRPARVPER